MRRVSQVGRASNAKHWLRAIAPFVVGGVLSILGGAAPVSAGEPTLRDKAHRAALGEEWKKLADDLLREVTDDPRKSPDPVLRLVKGHACLALNRNNESVCLFLSVQTGEDKQQCTQWAVKVQTDNPDKAFARYFFADACARQAKWADAISAYAKALAMAPGRPLLLNARGVAYARSGQLAEARVDFAAATADVKQPLADAHANIGQLVLQRKAGAEGAKRAFDKALQLSSDFAFALYGRGCVALVCVRDDEQARARPDAKQASEQAKKRSEEAAAYFQRAAEHARCAEQLLKDAQIDALARTQGVDRKEIEALLAGRDPGMSLNSTFQTVLSTYKATGKISQGDYNRFVSAFRVATPETQQAVLTQIKGTSTGDRGFQNQITLRGSNSVSWNEGAGRFFTLAGVSVGVGRPVGVGATFGNMTHIPSGNAASSRQILGAAGGISRQDGALASMAGAFWDEGDWPFSPCYGLCY